ncbi:MAG: CvpA family protein [Ruminococcaceae bacterium]|nr:CvpA family protein [Oscillospiraceae bacterium]
MIIDICLVLAVILFAFIGSKRGFVKEIVSLVGVVVSVLLALWVSDISAGFIYSSVIEKPVYNAVNSTIGENVEGVIDSSKATLEDVVPDELVSIAEKIGIDLDLSDKIDANGESAEVINNVTESIVQNIVEPICVKAISVIVFIVVFIVSMILISLLAKALNIVAKLPVLHSLNSLLGAVVGFARGAFVSVAVCYGLYLILVVLGDGLWGLDMSLFTDSKIMSIFI